MGNRYDTCQVGQQCDEDVPSMKKTTGLKVAINDPTFFIIYRRPLSAIISACTIEKAMHILLYFIHSATPYWCRKYYNQWLFSSLKGMYKNIKISAENWAGEIPNLDVSYSKFPGSTKGHFWGEFLSTGPYFWSYVSSNSYHTHQHAHSNDHVCTYSV